MREESSIYDIYYSKSGYPGTHSRDAATIFANLALNGTPPISKKVSK